MGRLITVSLGGLLLIAATAIVLHRPAAAPVEVPLRGPLDLVGSSLAGWTPGPPPSPDDMPEDITAPRRLLRTYRNGTSLIWVSVGYYPAQRAGQRPPARDLLFPGQGWTHLSEERVSLPLPANGQQDIPANLVVMDTAGRRLAILYWYQLGQQAIASDHWYRAVAAFNRLFHGRADGALVRVASPVPAGVSAHAVVARQVEFLRWFYPELLQRLPT